MTSVAVTDAVARPPARARTKPAFYLGIAFFMVGLVVVGFWPTYFGRLVRGDIARPLVVQIHGLVFVGWMALLVAQIVLAWRGRVQMHRRVGRWGIAYGILVLVMGVIVGIAAPVMHAHAGDWTRDRAAGFLLITFGDMVLFGSFFAAAVAYRRRPEIHKRLMIAATVALLFAAVGRMRFIESTGIKALIWLTPMFVGMAYDWFARRRVHPAYLVGTVGLFVGATRVLFTQSETWLRIARPIIDALT